MNEDNSGEIEPEVEEEKVHETLRNMAKELGFIETQEFQEVARQAIEVAQTPESSDNIDKLNNIIAKIQIIWDEFSIGENQVNNIGLFLFRASVLLESGRIADCRDDIYDASRCIKNEIIRNPEFDSFYQRLDEIDILLKRVELAEGDARELVRRREVGELDPTDYDLNYIFYLQQIGEPVTREDVCNKAIVINPEEFGVLGYIEFVTTDGEIIVLDFEEESFDKIHPLVIFPEELGK